jgi:hypothetical protein
MVLAGLLAIETAGAILGVGAAVVRPERPRIAVGRTQIAVANAAGAAVTVEGGTLRRARDGTLLIAPSGPGAVRIVFTY